MSKIRYKVGSDGQTVVSADVATPQGVRRIVVKEADDMEEGAPVFASWKQLTLDLFQERDRVQNEASERGRV